MKKLLILTSALVLIAASCNKQASVNNGQNNQSGSTQNSSETVQSTYNNVYGFTINFPKDWDLKTELDQNLQGKDVSTGKIIEQVPEIIYRNPNWTESKHYEDIPVMVFTLGQWYLVSAGKISLGGAPISPTELSRSNRFVFALPARYNYDYAEGWQEADLIAHTLKATDWKTYTNDQYGFQYQYPGYMTVTSYSQSNGSTTGTNFSAAIPDSKWSYNVNVNAPSKRSLTEVFNQYYTDWKKTVSANSDYQVKDFSTTDIKVSGVPAKELYVDHFGDVGSTQVFVVHDGAEYLISGGIDKGDLDPFLSTFKFTK